MGGVYSDIESGVGAEFIEANEDDDDNEGSLSTESASSETMATSD